MKIDVQSMKNIVCEKRAEGEGLYCVVGKTEEGEVHVCDLKKAPHMLVCGASGSGKSVLLHSIILSLAAAYTPEEVGLVLLDTKGTEFDEYHSLPHRLYKDLSVEEVLWKLSQKIENWEKDEKKTVVFIDEYAELEGRDRLLVEKLVRLGRGVGVHVILATQCVSKKCLTPVLKACARTVAVCKVSEKVDSLFLLGRTGAENLNGLGDMLFSDERDRIARLQSGYVGKKERAEFLAQFDKR